METGNSGPGATVVLYMFLVAAVGAERLLELALSRRNSIRVRSRGGFLAETRSYWDMVVFQGVWLAACPLEVWLLGRPWLPALGIPAIGLVVAAMALRYVAIRALGDRWNVRIFVVPGEPVVAAGPYRWVRHPNYLALLVETVALPLVHTAWITACALGALHLPLLARRIRLEERALARHGDYERVFDGRGRLLP